MDLGGLNMLFFKLEDRITRGNSASAYQYKIQECANAEDYPRLLKDIYKIATGEKLDLEHPVTFNEKIQWMKIYDSTPEKTRLADKYLVRDWVKDKIGERFLIPLLGVWDSFDDIDFDSLPDSFVLKCNHGCGMNLVVTDKSNMDRMKVKAQFDNYMKTNFAFVAGLEIHYRDIPRKIIAEEYIEQMDKDLLDYKIHVFQGEPKIIQLIGERDLENHRAKECFLTPEWVPEELMYHTYDMYDVPPEKPDNLEEMLKIARVLGEGFRYVRVDLYNSDGKILFGEMTFTPASGFGKWEDIQSAKIVGSWIKL